MRERELLRAHLAVLSAQKMLRALARSALSAALTEETRLQARADAMRVALDELIEFWHVQLNSRSVSIDGMQRTRLALDLAARDLREAEDASAAATAVVEDARRLVLRREAEVTHSQRNLEHLRKKLQRSHDERALLIHDERVARAWVLS